MTASGANEDNEEQKEDAVAAGWGVLQATLVRPGRIGAPPPRAEPAEVGRERRRPEPVPLPTPAAVEPHLAGLTVSQVVRSGQVVYAAGGDLVALAAVSSGAELIADGNIHVYAPLRGRALAGACDNPEASIFCMNLDAEFLSIAGRHLTWDEIPEAQRGRPARVHLRHGQVIITSL